MPSRIKTPKRSPNSGLCCQKTLKPSQGENRHSFKKLRENRPRCCPSSPLQHTCLSRHTRPSFFQEQFFLPAYPLSRAVIGHWSPRGFSSGSCFLCRTSSHSSASASWHGNRAEHQPVELHLEVTLQTLLQLYSAGNKSMLLLESSTACSWTKFPVAQKHLHMLWPQAQEPLGSGFLLDISAIPQLKDRADICSQSQTIPLSISKFICSTAVCCC